MNASRDLSPAPSGVREAKARELHPGWWAAIDSWFSQDMQPFMSAEDAQKKHSLIMAAYETSLAEADAALASATTPGRTT
jgi:hypothetical protein